jgi:hypothetical protein
MANTETHTVITDFTIKSSSSPDEDAIFGASSMEVASHRERPVPALSRNYRVAEHSASEGK